MQGRKPRATEQKIKEGNPGKRKLPAVVHTAGRIQEGEVVESPLPLGLDAQEWWDLHVPAMVKASILDRVDVTIAVIAAQSWEQMCGCQRVIDDLGLLGTGSRSQIVQAAWVKQWHVSAQTYMRACEQLGGIGAVSRARLGLAGLQGQTLAAMLDEIHGDSGSEVIDVTAVEDVGLPGL